MINDKTDLDYLALALQQAQACLVHQEVPIGAIVVNDAGQVIGTGRNTKETDQIGRAHV